MGSTPKSVAAWRKANPRKSILHQARHRAKQRGIPFDLKSDDIEIPEKCPVLGIALCVGTTTRQHKDCAPSLDRLVPVLGYVRGNVRVISHRANRLKGDALIEEIEAVLHYMKEANCL